MRLCNLASLTRCRAFAALVLVPLLGVATGLGQDEVAMEYPLAIASRADGTLLVVDTDVPGIFRIPSGGEPDLWVQGPKQLRQPLNRPRCITVAPDGTVLVGDTPSRDVYRIAEDGMLTPLTAGYVGIPMSLAVSDDGTVYVADLETMFILRFPLSGGEPEVFSKINTRGLFWDGEKLWGVTQTDQQVVTFDAEGKATPVVDARKMEFPHNVVVTDDGVAYVTDGYKKAIWQIGTDGQASVWHEGAPLQNPVGIALRDGKLVVADPHAKKVYAFDLQSKEHEVVGG